MRETSIRQLARWACRVTLDKVPLRVREQAVNQVLSTVAAVYSGWDSDLGRPIEMAFGPSPAAPGRARILPTGVPAPPTQAALVMAAWSMVLDFDDVMLGGHTGHSSVLVPLAIVTAGGRSGAELILAQIVANEVAARINMVCALGSTRGQMATHLHLLAAAAARAKLEGLDENHFAEALSFAISYPSQALFPAFLGSDAKALCAAFAVRVGMEAIDAVQAGLTAAEDPLDDGRGFFAALSKAPVREFLGGLGERWHTETNSFKIYPVCGYLCSTLDATLDLVHQHDVLPSSVAAVDVWASIFTFGMDAHSAPYLDGPRSRISTLTFSTPFTVASAILARRFTPEHLKRSWIENPRVWELAARTRSHFDAGITIDALTADIPIGAALRRTRRWQAAGFGWSLAGAAFGLRRWRSGASYRLAASLAAAAGDCRPFDFQRATKPLGSRVEIRLADGRTLTQTVSIPRGFAGAPRDHQGLSVRDLMRNKFVAAVGAAVGPERASEAARLVEDLPTLSQSDIRRLFDLITISAADAATDRMSHSRPV